MKSKKRKILANEGNIEEESDKHEEIKANFENTLKAAAACFETEAYT